VIRDLSQHTISFVRSDNEYDAEPRSNLAKLDFYSRYPKNPVGGSDLAAQAERDTFAKRKFAKGRNDGPNLCLFTRGNGLRRRPEPESNLVPEGTLLRWSTPSRPPRRMIPRGCQRERKREHGNACTQPAAGRSLNPCDLARAKAAARPKDPWKTRVTRMLPSGC